MSIGITIPNSKESNFDVNEAYNLWVNGYCFNGVSDRYKCKRSEVTRKLRPMILAEDRIKHSNKHRIVCTYCYVPKDNLTLF